MLNPGGLITVTGTNTLFLGSSGMDLSTASADLTLASSSVSCSANQSWNIAAGRTLTLTGWLNLYGAITVGSGASGSSGTLNLNGCILNVASTSASMSVGSYGVINANGVSVTNSSTGSVTLSAPMTLGPGGLNFVKQVVTHNLTLSSRLSGVGGFVSALGGTCNTYVTGNNTFTGSITISSGYLHNSGTYAVPVGCNLTNNGAWGMDKSVTLGSFAGSGSIFRDSSQGAAVLTVGYNNANGNYTGSIGEGNSSQLSLTKIGTGKFTISGTCSYTGTTTASNGTLLVDGVLRASPVEVRSGAALGGGGIISNNVAFANGAKALFTDTGTLTILGSVTGIGNIIHLNLSSNVTAGYYLLATCGSGAGSAFSSVPVVDNGSFAPGTTNYFITILSGSQVWLVVQKSESARSHVGSVCLANQPVPA